MREKLDIRQNPLEGVVAPYSLRFEWPLTF